MYNKKDREQQNQIFLQYRRLGAKTHVFREIDKSIGFIIFEFYNKAVHFYQV